MVLKTIGKIIPTRFKRAFQVLYNPKSMIEKQFVFAWQGGQRGNVEWHLTDYETYAKEGYSQNALAHMAIKVKVDALAIVPLRAYEGDVNNPTLLPPDNPLAMLAYRPNAHQSWYEFISLCDVYYNINGNAFIYKKPSTQFQTLPESLHALRPDRVLIRPYNNNGKGDVYYVYVPDGQTYQSGIRIHRDNMMHIKTPNPFDDLEGLGYGLPPLMPVSKEIDMDTMLTTFLFNIFAHQGVMPGGFIELPFEADPDDMMALRQQFLDSEGGYQNWGKPIVLDEGAQYRPASFTLDQLDAQMLDSRQIKRVMGVFGVPARLMGLDDAASTFSNVEEARKEFWNRTMQAELQVFEDELTFRLREEGQDWFVKFDTTDVPSLQQNLLEQSEIFRNFVQSGVPVNEVIALTNLKLPPVDGGDVGLVPMNLVPITDAGKQLEQSDFGTDEESDENDSDSEDTQDSEDSVEDVPTDEQDERAQEADLDIKIMCHRWDFDKKQMVYKQLDKISTDYESVFAERADAAFSIDRARIDAILSDSKAVINWQTARRSINLYLSTESPTMWRGMFAPVIIELTNAQTEAWIKRAPDVFPAGTFSLRNPEAEGWFNTYLLEFATAISDTTRNDIHRIIQDGLSSGLSNDKIAKALDDMFQQYIKGDVSPDDFDFLQERMPAYRRELIARTETHGASSAGNHELYAQAGIQRREWLATADGRTRDTHMIAWGTYSEGGSVGPILLQQDFSVGGFAMRYPGDKKAAIQEWIQCRCTELPYFE